MDGGSSSGGGSDAGDAAASFTWTQVYADFVGGHCAPCHSPSPDGGGVHGGFLVGHLDMSSVDAGYANLLNQPPQGMLANLADAAIPACDTLAADAGSDSGILRAIPNDPAHSLICLKVHGFDVTPPCGNPMPITGAIPEGGLPDGGGQEQAFDEIRAWILGGAKP